MKLPDCVFGGPARHYLNFPGPMAVRIVIVVQSRRVIGGICDWLGYECSFFYSSGKINEVNG